MGALVLTKNGFLGKLHLFEHIEINFFLEFKKIFQDTIPLIFAEHGS